MLDLSSDIPSAAASLKRVVDGQDDSTAVAMHLYDDKFYEQLQQRIRPDCNYQTLSGVRDASTLATLASEASCLAFRSNMFSSSEARSPALQQRRTAPLQQHLQQAMQHSDHDYDSGIYELTTMLNR